MIDVACGPGSGRPALEVVLRPLAGVTAGIDLREAPSDLEPAYTGCLLVARAV